MQESHILLTPDKELNKVFHDIPVVGFHNGTSLKDHLVKAKLPNVGITGRSQSCGKGNCQVCDFLCDTDTFSIKTCGETFKIQSGVLKCRICGEAPYVGKAKMKFRAIFNNYKSAHRSCRKKHKVSQQCFHEYHGQHSHNSIDDWQFTLIEQCETHE